MVIHPEDQGLIAERARSYRRRSKVLSQKEQGLMHFLTSEKTHHSMLFTLVPLVELANTP